MNRIDRLYMEMIRYYQGDPKHIQHFVKVHSFSRLIGQGEGLDEDTMYILEAAALVHDIGIKVGMENMDGLTERRRKQRDRQQPGRCLHTLDLRSR